MAKSKCHILCSFYSSLSITFSDTKKVFCIFALLYLPKALQYGIFVTQFLIIYTYRQNNLSMVVPSQACWKKCSCLSIYFCTVKGIKHWKSSSNLSLQLVVVVGWLVVWMCMCVCVCSFKTGKYTHLTADEYGMLFRLATEENWHYSLMYCPHVTNNKIKFESSWISCHGKFCAKLNWSYCQAKL